VLILVDIRVWESPLNWMVPRRPIKWAEVTRGMAPCPDDPLTIIGLVCAIRGLDAGASELSQ
jgi:hypothetical protein